MYCSGLLIFLCSPGLTDIPDSLPILFLVIVIILFLLDLEKIVNYRFLLRTTKFFFSVLILNLFWLLPWFVTLLRSSVQIAMSTSNSGKMQAENYVNIISKSSSFFDASSLRNSFKLMKEFSWPQFAYSDWFSTFFLFGLVPLAIIVLAWIYDAFDTRLVKTHSDAFYGMVALTIVFTCLVSLGSVPFSVEIFNWCTFHIPLFVSQRNFYKVYSVPLVLASSIACGIAILRLSAHLKKRTLTVLLVTAASCFMIYGFPLVAGTSFRLPISTTGESGRLISKLPTGYISAADYVLKYGPENVVSFPVLGCLSQWTFLNDMTPNKNSYLGVSPLRYIYGFTNYVATSSFGSISNETAFNEASRLMTSDNPEGFASLILKKHVSYVLYDSQSIRDKNYRPFSTFVGPKIEKSFYQAVLHDLHAVKVMQVGNYELLNISKPINLPSNSKSNRFIQIDKIHFVSLLLSVVFCSILVFVKISNRQKIKPVLTGDS